MACAQLASVAAAAVTSNARRVSGMEKGSALDIWGGNWLPPAFSRRLAWELCFVSRSARRRHFSPVALIGALMPFVLVLLLYTRAWDAAPKFAFPWDASQWFTALKPAPVHTTQPSRLTFSRSWYIESSVASKIADMQALGQQDVHWMVS